MNIGAVLTARSLDEYTSVLPLCYTPPSNGYVVLDCVNMILRDNLYFYDIQNAYQHTEIKIFITIFAFHIFGIKYHAKVCIGRSTPRRHHPGHCSDLIASHRSYLYLYNKIIQGKKISCRFIVAFTDFFVLGIEIE